MYLCSAAPFSYKESVFACFQTPCGQLWGLEQLLTAQLVSPRDRLGWWVGADDSGAGAMEDRL